jgi:hypothetical protein
MKTRRLCTVALAALIVGAGPHAAQPQSPADRVQVAPVFAGRCPMCPERR